MQIFTEIVLRAREWHKRSSQGWIVTDYSLIVAGVALVFLITYQLIGTGHGISTDLTSAR